jgi:excisionase family DNA binding protein
MTLSLFSLGCLRMSVEGMVREVMNIHQAAEFLGISSDTLYKYAGEGTVPAFKLGNRWRFRRVRLEEWMDRKSGVKDEHPN